MPVVWNSTITGMFANDINNVDFGARYTSIRNDRRQRARFTCSYTQITSALMYNTAGGVDPALNAVGVKFCSYPGTTFNAEISDAFPLATLNATYATSADAFNAVVSGECNATVNDKYALGAVVLGNNASVALSSSYSGVASDFIGFFAAPDNCAACTGMIPETGNQALRLAVDAAQLAVTSGEYNPIATKYGLPTGYTSDCSANAAALNLNTYPVASGVLADALSKREITIVADDNYLPYSSLVNGTWTGFTIEYTQLVFAKIAAQYNVSGFNVKFVIAGDVAATFIAKLATNGSFSGSFRQVFLSTNEDIRNQVVASGCSVYAAQAAVMSNFIGDLTNAGVVFSVRTGSAYGTLISTLYPAATISYYATNVEAMNAVLVGASNATINDRAFLGAFITQNNASSFLTIGVDTGKPTQVGLQFRYDVCPACRGAAPTAVVPLAPAAAPVGVSAPKVNSASSAVFSVALIAAAAMLAILL